MAKKAMDLSKFDQENLQLKINEWKAVLRPMFSFHFRPHCSVDVHNITPTTPTDSDQASNEKAPEEQTILYVHQEN